MSDKWEEERRKHYEEYLENRNRDRLAREIAQRNNQILMELEVLRQKHLADEKERQRKEREDQERKEREARVRQEREARERQQREARERNSKKYWDGMRTLVLKFNG